MENPYGIKIIDAHVHIARVVSGFGDRGELQAIGGGLVQYANGDIFALIPPELGEYGVTPEAMLRLMDKNGVERALLLQGNFLGNQNLYTLDAMRQYPDRFLGAAAYDPWCAHKDELRSYLFETCGFSVIKWEVSSGSGLMSYHPPFAIDGSEMDEEMRYAQAHNAVCVFDIGWPGAPCWQPQALARLARRYPDMKFVACHLIAPRGRARADEWREGMRALALDNVWFDLASVTARQKPETYPYPTALYYMEQARQIVGAGRMMFGTDTPSNLCKDTYEHYVRQIADSDIFTDDEKENIFYNTANSVYWTR